VRRPFFALLLIALAVTGVGCPCTRSAVNASPELRWWLFSNFGASKVCPEMLKRGVPLKLPQFGAASIGRFFPAQCFAQVDDARKAMTMSVAGSGYVTLPFTHRIGFSIGINVEYLPDFRLEEDATYVWGRFNRFVSPPALRIIGVETPALNLATQTPFGNVAALIGNVIVASEIGRGFTVVRRDDGDDFALGHLDPPAKPARQFKAGDGHVVLASDLTSVYTRSREFLGPFEVADKDAALFLHAKVEGAPLTYAIADRSVGEAWRRQYELAQPIGPPPGNVIGQGPLGLGEPNLGFPLNPGVYYIVLENTAPPPLLNIGEPVAHVGYSVEIGERR
jgi:hypothetical protein